MTVDRRLPRLASALVVLTVTVIWICHPQVAHAASLKCAATTSSSTPASPSAGQPCWVDVTPYPFGSDGNPVDPTSALCVNGGAFGPNNYGPNWDGDFNPFGDNIQGNPACYEQVTSMAFRAWNRGLATTSGGPFGVWLYNGTNWFPDPTFPGSSVCPGTTVLWAGKLDYWLIGSSTHSVSTLCRFDGVNLVWDPLTLPAATVAHWPLNLQGQRAGGITAGTCFAWNNCWFFGTDGVEVHWDGQELTDETGPLGSSPWLQEDFVTAAGTVTPNGTALGLALGAGQSTQTTVSNGVATIGQEPLQNAPDGTTTPDAFGSTGGPWSPLAHTVPGDPLGPIPAGTAPVVAAMDTSGDTWLAEHGAEATPLMRLSPDGTAYPCTGYGATTFPFQSLNGYTWTSLAVAPPGGVAPGGIAFAGGTYSTPTQQFQAETGSTEDVEPVIVQAACGKPPTSTEFRIPDPFDNTQATPSVPADFEASLGITAVAAPATNDVWAAAGEGTWLNPTTNKGTSNDQRPHLYLFTDGQAPDAPAGDDNETRPSLFTLSPPVYQVTSPTVVVTPTTTTTTTTKGKPKTVKEKPAIYDTHTKLQTGGTRAKPTYVLHLTFKVRRPVTVGLEALKGKRVVARTPMRRFKGRTGELSVSLNRKAWPTGLKLISPPAKKAASH